MTTTTPPELRLGPAYTAPGSVEEALRVLQADPSAAVLGGGTLAMPRLLDQGFAGTVLDLAAVAETRHITPGAQHVVLGATTTYSDLLASPLAPPLLRTIASGITGGPQIRNQATIGGSACHAGPASDVPTGLVSVGAVIVLARAGGARRVPAHAFFRAPFAPDLEPGELLTGIEVAHRPARGGWGYVKLTWGESSWPIVTAAAHVVVAADGVVHSGELTIGAATEVPVRITLGAEVVGDSRNAATLDAAIAEQVARDGVGWWSDELADARYRRRVAAAVAARALTTALTDSEGGRA